MAAPTPDPEDLADEIRDQTLDRPPPGTGGTSDDDDQPDDAKSTGRLGDAG